MAASTAILREVWSAYDPIASRFRRTHTYGLMTTHPLIRFRLEPGALRL